MTPENLSAIAGIALSLILSGFPKLSDWYAGLTSTSRRMILAAGVVVIGLLAVGVSCGARQYGIDIAYLPACTESGITQFINSTIAAFVTSQATYTFTPAKASGQG